MVTTWVWMRYSAGLTRAVRVAIFAARVLPGRGFQPSQETTMKSRIALAAGALLFSGAALAFHCPADMKKIDEALAKNPKLTEAQMAEVKKQRAEGEALHKAGKHQESVDTLAKAMKTLGVQ
jgi:hypothetical protein